MNSKRPRNIVIIGGGVVGCACAYYLTSHQNFEPGISTVTILEAVHIASGSSGKAGGLLQIAAEPACLAPLSFKLHAELADEHDGRNKWGYRTVNVGECSLSAGQHWGTDTAIRLGDTILSSGTGDLPEALDWILAASLKSYGVVGTPQDSAQVHPYLFTTTLASLAGDRGSKIIIGTAVRINYSDGDTRVDSVSYRLSDGPELYTLQATDIILAAGPWTSSLFPPASIGGAKSHSIIIRPSRPLSNNCLWANIDPGRTGTLEKDINLEIYPRPDNTLYSCEWADATVPLPPTSNKVQVDKRRCKVMWDALASISDELARGEVIIEQACYQPVILREGHRAKNAGPLLGCTGIEGLLLACGHDSWGVQNAPGTGKVISEMVFQPEAQSTDVTSLDPRTILNVKSWGNLHFN